MMCVYILSFSKPLGNERHQARYYIGYCADARLNERYLEHVCGVGAAITRAAVRQNATIVLEHAFMGAGRDFEFYLKSRKETGKILRRVRQKTFTYPGPATLRLYAARREALYITSVS